VRYLDTPAFDHTTEELKHELVISKGEVTHTSVVTKLEHPRVPHEPPHKYGGVIREHEVPTKLMGSFNKATTVGQLRAVLTEILFGERW
jgi:hypothetical protein